MPRGSKAKYSAKQKRMARHIEAGYESRGVGEGEAERRAWATVNADTGGGARGGGSRKKKAAKAKSSRPTGAKRKKSARRKTAAGRPRSPRG